MKIENYDSRGNLVSGTQAPFYANRVLVTGSSDAGPSSMAGGNVLRIWNNASGGTQNMPAASGTLNLFTVIDISGGISSGSPVTMTPASGAVVGASVHNNVLYLPNSQRTWVDDANGWTLQS